MLNFLLIIFAITVVSLGGYGLITEDFKFQPYNLLFLGLVTLVLGIKAFLQGYKVLGWLSIVAFIFVLFVSIRSILFY
ncbi:DUF3953 domain-containing protein [Virgibacillus litoralis]|uniref:Phosphoglycerol transferase MdoB-like AlkP superfamily enzyme n=1 Tax=Virgibacillus litoralis TaxID=578221 RepID=A0ABS4H8G3_9BACI|nr:DUF3953 domain-containing protein [Virgibacillus litoralis]MBP1947200.1 phosphoglycerol transferase MdoB-like AlkP superfamily enzyme [Virgibacillus litoralis]